MKRVFHWRCLDWNRSVLINTATRRQVLLVMLCFHFVADGKDYYEELKYIQCYLIVTDDTSALFILDLAPATCEGIIRPQIVYEIRGCAHVSPKLLVL